MPVTRTIARRGVRRLHGARCRGCPRIRSRTRSRPRILQACPFCGHGKKKRRGRRSRGRRSRRRRSRRRRSGRRRSVRRISARRMTRSRRRSGKRVQKPSRPRKSRIPPTRTTIKRKQENPNPQQPNKQRKQKESTKAPELEIPSTFHSHLDTDMPQHSAWARPRTDRMVSSSSQKLTSCSIAGSSAVKARDQRLCQVCMKPKDAALNEEKSTAVKREGVEKKGSTEEDHHSDSSSSSSRSWKRKIRQATVAKEK